MHKHSVQCCCFSRVFECWVFLVQMGKDPDVRLEALFVLGDTMAKEVLMLRVVEFLAEKFLALHVRVKL